MYISNLLMTLYLLVIIATAGFVVAIVRTRQILLIHKTYFAAAGFLVLWLLALIAVKFTDPANTGLLVILDGITTVGGAFIPPCSLLFAICYTKEFDNNLPRRYYGLFIVPTITALLIFTNEHHHLYYSVFSLVSTQVQFGPYFMVHFLYTFTCVALSIFIIVRFAFKTKNRLHILQASLFTIGTLAPSVTNLLVMTNVIQASIAVMPLGFIVTMIFHSIVIFRLHFFDIKPIAIQQLINWIADCYLVTNQSGLVISYNRPFMELFGNQYQIRENLRLQECIQTEDVENKTAMYNLLTAIRSSQESHARVTYEQAVSLQDNGETIKRFYMAEVTPLIIKGEVCGFLSILKDITQIKKNMQKLQDSQVRMMEQERLAFLGQMVGGLAYNLKTPIMSISGGVSAVETLISESRVSLGDPEVNEEDYLEIYSEMDGWLHRIREACAYMSDIISAVKGQASNMNVSSSTDFSLSETFKRVSLLLRHELLNRHCNLVIEGMPDERDILIHGDINNLVQVINNLVSNAIDAQLPQGRHDIVIGVGWDSEALKITIKDYGAGISAKVRQKLFQEMVTSKGNLGTGLGVFISNTVIRAKFNGSMWFDDNPEGGTIWGISIPLDNTTISDGKGGETP